MTTPTSSSSYADDVPEREPEAEKRRIDLYIPPRILGVVGTAVTVGAAVGMMRGGRTTSLRFLAENAHRAPTTVQGWYFYKKTKNYRVMLGALQGAGRHAAVYGGVALGFVGMEEGLERVGWGRGKHVGAAVGTVLVLSALNRLPMQTTLRAVGMGGIVGMAMTGLEMVRGGRKPGMD